MNLKSYIINLVKEEIGGQTPVLCPLDIKKMGEHMAKNNFGTLDSHRGFNLKMSKSLYLNGEVIGGYMLRKASMMEVVNMVLKYKSEFKNLKFFVDKDFLKKYSGKKGIYSDYIYIDEKYNGNEYAKILIDYSKSLGDYVWGGSEQGRTSEYWLNKTDRIKIFEYIDEKGRHALFSATPI